MKTVTAALLALGVVACTPTPQAPGNEASAPASSASVDATSPVPATTAAPTAAPATTTLAGYHWRLASASNKDGQRIDALFARADKPLQLDFDGHAISVSNTCNRMHGNYSLHDGKLEIGALASTLMACNDPALTALDAAASKFLAGRLGYAVAENHARPELTLTGPQGERLVFDGVPTAETRYGSKGETVFLEVAPDTKPCNDPGMPDARCLEVRELHYGSNGVREGQPGPWHVLGQDIEGYSHQPGTRQVLRVKRYRVTAPPADGSSVALVLDMVVETELPPH